MGRSLLLVGLRGPYSLEARAQAVLLGLLGTLLLNLARMAAVALVATRAALCRRSSFTITAARR